jgi:CHASE2 domain-containing sensor protein/class 3 adenylate cyclase
VTQGKSRKSKIPRGGFAVLLGLAATLLVVAGHWAGMDRWLELGSLDARFRWLATAPPTDDIVNVDIDDRSLDEIGRWPWPREQLAGVVETLEQCGARAVALDIILPEPQKVRYEPGFRSDSLEDKSPALGIFDDAILAGTIASHDNVFIPMHVVPRPQPPTPAESAMQAIVFARQDISLEDAEREALDRLRKADANGETEAAALSRAYLRARALAEMRRFAIGQGQADDCPVIEGGLVPPLVTLGQATRHTGFVTFDPDGDGTVRRIPLLARSGTEVYPQFALSIAAEELARRGGQPCTLTAGPEGVVLHFGALQRVVPVDGQGYMTINWVRGGENSARHVSAGTVGELWQLQKEHEDAAARRFFLFKELFNLPSAKAFRTQKLQDAYWQLTPGGWCQEWDTLRTVQSQEQARRYEAMLFDPSVVARASCPRVPWASRPRASSSSSSVLLPSPNTSDEERQEEANEGKMPSPRGAEQLEKQIAFMQGQIDRVHDQFLAELRDANHLDFFLGRPSSAEAATRPSLMADFLASRARARAILAQIEGLPDSLRRKRERLDRDLAHLRELVAGKICLIGSTATGAADFVPTPMQKRMPGVMVHANIVNTILSGRFVRPAGWAADLAAILLCGLAVSIVTARRPVWQSGPMAAGLAAVYAATAAAVVFHLWDIWLAMVAPLVAMLLAFLVVTAYRQFTEERAKRQIRSLFASTLSPELVDRLTEDPSLLNLGGERRPLSCFFSDLQGFTPLSEKLGEQVTGRLLNRYFDHMTEIIRNRQGGTMNKFMGDGIFAFFGAPIFQDDHAARAVRAAVDYVAELKVLNPRLAGEFHEPVNLFCRIGIATGEVMVGNYGSSDKFDYTAIGDTVNLASRLEGANKSFGTHILVDEATWKQAGDLGVVARCLGRVRVVGKNESVAVWNPLGWRKDLSPEAAEAAEGFTRATELYARREFPAAAELVEEYLKVVPGDKAAEMYVDLCRNAVAAPGDEWDGTLRLTQK